jgi:hypothetical protein
MIEIIRFSPGYTSHQGIQLMRITQFLWHFLKDFKISPAKHGWGLPVFIKEFFITIPSIFHIGVLVSV